MTLVINDEAYAQWLQEQRLMSRADPTETLHEKQGISNMIYVRVAYENLPRCIGIEVTPIDSHSNTIHASVMEKRNIKLNPKEIASIKKEMDDTGKSKSIVQYNDGSSITISCILGENIKNLYEKIDTNDTLRLLDYRELQHLQKDDVVYHLHGNRNKLHNHYQRSDFNGEPKPIVHKHVTANEVIIDGHHYRLKYWATGDYLYGFLPYVEYNFHPAKRTLEQGMEGKTTVEEMEAREKLVQDYPSIFQDDAHFHFRRVAFIDLERTLGQEVYLMPINDVLVTQERLKTVLSVQIRTVKSVEKTRYATTLSYTAGEKTEHMSRDWTSVTGRYLPYVKIFTKGDANIQETFRLLEFAELPDNKGNSVGVSNEDICPLTAKEKAMSIMQDLGNIFIEGVKIHSSGDVAHKIVEVVKGQLKDNYPKMLSDNDLGKAIAPVLFPMLIYVGAKTYGEYNPTMQKAIRVSEYAMLGASKDLVEYANGLLPLFSSVAALSVLLEKPNA
jgi:hypothetical protein